MVNTADLNYIFTSIAADLLRLSITLSVLRMPRSYTSHFHTADCTGMDATRTLQDALRGYHCGEPGYYPLTVLTAHS